MLSSWTSTYWLMSLLFCVVSTASNAVEKRQSDFDMSCYTATKFSGLSALCAAINYPIKNELGLNIFELLYFAMKTTKLPPSTTYEAQENIICATRGSGQNITVTVGADVGVGPASVGAKVSFDLNAGALDNGGM
jgi:hypothetical protein